MARPDCGGVALPPVATTSYSKLRSWPTAAIWWPLTGRDVLSVPLHHLARDARTGGPRFGDPGRYPIGPQLRAFHAKR
jgi:hypothetical protein